MNVAFFFDFMPRGRVAPFEHLPENVQQSPTNHSPNIAQGHFTHAEQTQGFQQQPVPLSLYHQ